MYYIYIDRNHNVYIYTHINQDESFYKIGIKGYLWDTYAYMGVFRGSKANEEMVYSY